MKDVSAIRILLMRAMYVVLFLGLAINVWPSIAHHRADLPRMNGVVLAVMGGIGLVSVLGIRHPVRMIPLLLFELTWKSIWLVAFALPRYLDHTLDAGM